MNKIILSFCTLFTLLFLSACKYDSASPIRDIRFDPKLLGRMQTDEPSPCANHYFFEKNTRQHLGAVSSDYVLVAFKPDLNHNSRQQVVERFGFVDAIAGQANSRSAMLYTLKLVSGLNCREATRAIEELLKDDAVTYAAPYFVKLVNGKHQLTGISNELIVKVKSGDAGSLKRDSDSYNVATVTATGDKTFVIAVDKNSEGNALETANSLMSQRDVEIATPEFIVFTENE